MVRSTFFGLEIGKTGLTVSQIGLDVTGHNIANVDTKGYTRQRIISTAYDPFATIGKLLPVTQANVGGGVRVKILDQIRSAYLDRRYRTENTLNSYWQKRTESLTYLESYFDNVNEETSISFSLARFFQAMKVEAEDTVEGAPRTLLQTAGMDLVQQLNSIYEGLVDLQATQNDAVLVTIDEINRIATEIVELNKVIYGYEITGNIANDLRDKRNDLVDELSSIVDVEYREYPDSYGQTEFEVKIGGELLVKHDKSWVLGVRETQNPIDGEAMIWQPCWLDPDTGEPYTTLDSGGNLVADEAYDLKTTGGELQAYIDMREGDGVGTNPKGIPYFIEMLNNFARALVQEINKVHREGYYDHPIHGSDNGVNFFDAKDADGNYLDVDPYDLSSVMLVTAKNLCLSEKVEESAYYIAASSVKIVSQGEPEELQRGNNENMNDLYALFLLKNISLGDISLPGGVSIGSFDGYATAIRFEVGNTLRVAKKTAENCNTLTLSAENQRTSVAGVSLDEEMTNLIKYQHAYNGAARVITTMDEMLDKLINGTGRVGL